MILSLIFIINRFNSTVENYLKRNAIYYAQVRSEFTKRLYTLKCYLNNNTVIASFQVL